MRNHYEITTILKLEGGESQLKDFAVRVNEIINRMDGTIISMESWGEKKLAYEIAKNLKGHYLYTNFSGPGPVVYELERNLRIMEPVLKFMTIRLDTDEEALKKLEEDASGISGIIGHKEHDHDTVLEEEEETETPEKDDNISDSKEYNKKLREALSSKKKEEKGDDDDVEL